MTTIQSTINRKIKKFRDIDLSFSMNPITKDIGLKTDEKAVKNSIKNLVLTKPFETPFHPEISCQAFSMLFENMSPITSEIVRATVIQVIDKFEPRVQLLDVTVSPNYDSNSYELTVQFILIGSSSPITISLSLDRAR